VIDTAAVGVPDAYRGEVILAFVVHDPSSEITEAELLVHSCTPCPTS
jgi:acyl-coenzyme A synthetase/AMP-(fatty) acid ligase